jgi:hypothetical protein
MDFPVRNQPEIRVVTGRLVGAVLFCFGMCAPHPGASQTVEIRNAEMLVMPGPVDSNSPAVWHGGKFVLFNSANVPFRAEADNANDVFNQLSTQVLIDNVFRQPIWIEAAWRRADGTIYAWYHHEMVGFCPDWKLSVPVIGALVSRDGGVSFEDLGIVLASGDPVRCDAQNGYFVGGHGDFTVIPDPEHQYFYFYFGNYGGSPEAQGISVARMAFRHLDHPVGAVYKYFEGAWDEPGLGGRSTPIFPVNVPWERADTDAFWGPAIHWNTYLESYVMLLNRSCCEPGFPQEGIYISLNPDISDPEGWTTPAPILKSADFEASLGWYPQVLGMEPGETDTVAGKKARLFLHGTSFWEIEFER